MLNYFRRSKPSGREESSFDWDRKNRELIELVNAGKISEAIQPAQELLEYVDKAHKKDSKEKATTYNNMGMVFLLAKDYQLAEECFRDALQMRKRLYGSDHNEVAVILLNLSHLYKAMAQEILTANPLEVRGE